MIHAVKIESEFFGDVLRGIKNWEVRNNDRDYHVNDLLALNEIDVDGNYTDRATIAIITYVFSSKEYLKDGYVILSIRPVDIDPCHEICDYRLIGRG